jgi:hypothetical protein
MVAGLVCSKFNHSTNELEPGSLKLDDFRNESVVKSFRDPGITVEEHLDLIMTKQIEAPMFTNAFPLSAYIPKTGKPGEDAGKLIEGAKLQSLWISRFKVGSARITLPKNIATWLKTIQAHSTGQTRSNPKYRPNISGEHAPVIVHQTDTKLSTFKKTMEDRGDENDAAVYGFPSCITSEAWNAYINAPFDPIARRAFVQTITFPCIDKTKKTDMTPPFGITYKSVTTDLGTVATKNGPRKVDARLYNAYLLIPGIVLHLSSKAKSIAVNELCGGTFEVNVINFVAKYGNYTRKSPFVTMHGAYSKYIDVMTEVKWINGLTGKNQIIPVTMFLVMLYNACFMFQQDKETNMLISALHTFDLGADVDHEKFMNTLSEYKIYDKFHSGILRIKHLRQ